MRQGPTTLKDTQPQIYSIQIHTVLQHEDPRGCDCRSIQLYHNWGCDRSIWSTDRGPKSPTEPPTEAMTVTGHSRTRHLNQPVPGRVELNPGPDPPTPSMSGTPNPYFAPNPTLPTQLGPFTRWDQPRSAKGPTHRSPWNNRSGSPDLRRHPVLVFIRSMVGCSAFSPPVTLGSTSFRSPQTPRRRLRAGTRLPRCRADQAIRSDRVTCWAIPSHVPSDVLSQTAPDSQQKNLKTVSQELDPP